MACFMSCLCVSRCMKMIVISFHLQNMGTFKCLALRMCIMWWLCNMSVGNVYIKIHNYCNFFKSTNSRNKIYGIGIKSEVSLNGHQYHAKIRPIKIVNKSYSKLSCNKYFNVWIRFYQEEISIFLPTTKQCLNSSTWI